VLDRVGAGVGVRLACQLRPIQNLAFAPLLPPNATIADVHRRGPTRSGEERHVVIMFVDMRGSSRLAEQRLPYDTVFIINQSSTPSATRSSRPAASPIRFWATGSSPCSVSRTARWTRAGGRSPHAPASPRTLID
jgi:hypothetical protein